jgi:hypothetical protein
MCAVVGHCSKTKCSFFCDYFSPTSCFKGNPKLTFKNRNQANEAFFKSKIIKFSFPFLLLIACWVEISFHVSNSIIIVVTEDGLFTLDLMLMVLSSQKCAGRTRLIVPGTFSGLEVLEPYSEYPMILTTQKNSTCCFLEIRGAQ